MTESVARVPHGRTCGTQPVHRRLLNESPDYVAARDQIETATVTGVIRLDPEVVVTIPVAVHVVTPAEAAWLVTDEQVEAQIASLTADFRARNEDVAKVPEVFGGLVGDAGVEFTLAEVRRVTAGRPSFSTDDAVKSAQTGGSDPVDPARTLNMWVSVLRSGLLGYAQFPGGPVATDGVVVTYAGFGTGGSAVAPFNRGRTTTHEVGHWLNLFHIWGDDGTGCGGSDEVADTPNCAGPNYGSPRFPRVTCNNGPDGDLFMNYMDYVDDGAMHMFTTGQVTRMRACLAGPRAAFVPSAP